MKLIKAFIRPELLDGTIIRLEEAGARDIAVIRVDCFGSMVDYLSKSTHSLLKYNEKYSNITKMEVVCRDQEVDKFVSIIYEHAHTGEHGDGRIFVVDVIRALNIRNGAEGETAL